MNLQYTGTLPQKLRHRVDRVIATDNHVSFHFALKRFWDFVIGHPVFAGMLQELDARRPTAEAKANRIVARHPTHGDDELEHAALSYHVIRLCAESDSTELEWTIGHTYGRSKSVAEHLRQFRQLFLEPLATHLDEQLTDQSVVLYLLDRYKQKCEWFRRTELFDLWKGETRRGEKNLAMHLYEYLHDQGVDIVIEPWSASGEVDLIASQERENPLLADAKIHAPKTSKRDIGGWFRQMYQYTQDYNEPLGYLVVYDVSEKDLRFELSAQEQLTPHLTHNDKTVFFITIDIFPHAKTASKRGKLDTAVISAQDLIDGLNE